MYKTELDKARRLDENPTNINKKQTVQNWIESLGNGDDDYRFPEDLHSVADSSVVESSDSEYDSYEFDDDDDNPKERRGVTTTELGTKIAPTEISTITESLKELLNTINSVQTVGNVNIENSTGVHIGNITNINGNIQIIHGGNGYQQRNSRNKTSADCERKVRRSAAKNITTENDIQSGPCPVNSNQRSRRKLPAKEEREECVRKDAFIEHIKVKLPQRTFSIIPRSSWLAQRPLEEYEYLEEPVEYIIISHTATESSERQAVNIGIIRDIQCFHIESRAWNDIAYNFLLGCDGNVYEGRNWGVVGAHTMGYNTCALGFSFIGCFMRELPTQAALNACKQLLKKGVEAGHIAADYKLLCHCQCRSTESPGRRLYEEIQTWDHFYNAEEE